MARRIPLPVGLKLAGSILFCGIGLLESLSWLGEFLHPVPEPALLHPQLGADLLLSIGFYSAWAVAWPLVLRRFQFGLRELIVVHGVYGIVIEQQGQVLIGGLVTLPGGLALWGFVFVAYGSTMGLAYLPFQHEIDSVYGPRSRSRWKYVWVLMSIMVLNLAIGSLWSTAIDPVLPPRQPISEHPFW